MDFQITDAAMKILSTIKSDHFIQLSFAKGSCDIVNNIYEMKVVKKREPEAPYEKIITVKNIEFLVEMGFEDVYDNQLVIDYSNGLFIFKNNNQIFNNKIGLRFIK
jgi:hypothetical protein